MTAGGLQSWRQSATVGMRNADFAALIFAAIRKADTGNAERLRAAFPELCAEAQARYDAPGGIIPGDPVLRRGAGSECPHCGRVMSHREASEQGACNECTG